MSCLKMLTLRTHPAVVWPGEALVGDVVAVAPALVAHVAGELRDEAAVAKERRKAREEASLRDKR